MKKFTLKRNATDPAMFEMWSEDERYLVAIIHEDHLGLMGKFGAGNYAELVLAEEEMPAGIDNGSGPPKA